MKDLDLADSSDAALVEFTRAGVSQAYGELWRRHSGSVAAVARSYTQFDADDIMQEAFVRVYEQILAGGGPTTAFRAYLGMTARNIATNMSKKRANGEVTGAETLFEAREASTPNPETFVLGNAVTMTAFKSLPTRWQEILWYRDVEELPVSECGTYIGMSENSASALLKRAREGFKQAWIAANLDIGRNLSRECEWLIENLPKHMRGKMSVSGIERVQAHLEGCERCAIIAEESEHIHKRLALVIFPALFGGAGAVSYKAWVQSGGNQVVSALPSAANVVTLKSAPDNRVKIASMAAAAVFTVTAASVFAFAGTSNIETAPAPTPVSSPPTAESEKGESTAQSTPDQKTAPLEASNPVTTAPGPAPLVSAAAPPVIEEVPAVPMPGPAPTPEPPPFTPPEIVQTVSAIPMDGIEVGVYPVLQGVGTSGAKITLTVTNEDADTITETVTVDADGTWEYTPHTLLGVLTVTATQSYLMESGTVVEPVVWLGDFRVGYGLTIDVWSDGHAGSIIVVSGLEEPRTVNQVANVRSNTIGDLSGGVYIGGGKTVFIVAHPANGLGDLLFWQGNTSTGPWQTWSRGT